MTSNPIKNACRLLREGAAELKNCHTLAATGHDWTGEPEAKAAYDEHMATADALERVHAGCETLRSGYAATRLEIESLRARSLPEIKDMHNGPQQLNLRDRAMWVLGWNECRDAARDADRAMRAAQPAGAQQPGAATWRPLPGALPEPRKPVLLDIGMKYPIRAMWVQKFTLPVGMEDDSGEYDEATDDYYCPEGWYEWNEREECHWRVDETPVSWCELPSKDASHGQAPAQAAPADTEALDVLRAFAEGRINHINEGLCPDSITGPNSRDPDCRVCRALDEAAPAAVAGPSADGLLGEIEDWLNDLRQANFSGYVPQNVFSEAGDFVDRIEQLRDPSALATQPAPQHATPAEPVHGDVLPPVGSRVFIRHGRDDYAHACTVTGYYAWCDLKGNKRLHRVFVRMVYEGTEREQARMLCDCYPTVEAALAEAAPQQEPIKKGGEA